MRWGLGPVFFYECLANSRRWQTYAIRSAGVALLLAAIATIAMPSTTIDPRYAWREYAALGESYFYAIIGVELTLVMLAAPAATAGRHLRRPRPRHPGPHARHRPLRPRDRPGQAGRAAPAGPGPGRLLLAGPGDLLAPGRNRSPGADARVRDHPGRRPARLHDGAGAVGVGPEAARGRAGRLHLLDARAAPLADLVRAVHGRSSSARRPAGASLANPYYLAFAPYSAPGRLDFWDYLGFFAATLGAAVALAVLAVWRMRPVARRGTDEGRKGRRLGWVGRLSRWLPGPSLDGNPVLWREWHRSRPSRWMTILVVLVGGSTGVACVVGAVIALIQGLDVRPGAEPVGLIVGVCGAILQLIFGLLMLSAVAPTSMAEERQRGSLDLLAATTLSTPTIVLGKWLGTLRQVALLAIGPGLLGLALALAVKAPQTIPPGTPGPVLRGIVRRVRCSSVPAS